MAKQTINLGTAPSGTGGDTSRSANTKLQANDDEIYSNYGTGSTLYGVGTSGDKVPLLSNKNTWSKLQSLQDTSTSYYSGEGTFKFYSTLSGWILMAGAYDYTNKTTTANFVVTQNGNVVNANNSYGSLSDIKFKENIEDAKSQINDIKSLRFVNYNLKGMTDKQLGLIAQEVVETCPYLVERNFNPDLEEEFLSLKYSVLNVKVAKAVQELILRIEAIEDKLNEPQQ